MFDSYLGTGKSKSSILKRRFPVHHLRSERKRNEQNLETFRYVPALKLKWGPQNAYYVKEMETYAHLDSYTGNLNSFPGNLTNYVHGTELNISTEEVCGTFDNFEQSWHSSVVNRSQHLNNSSNQASSLHPSSALSSGYSSVNQSCASSAGTGSQRSRSPTPDQFETLKEESSLRETGRFGHQSQNGGESCTTRSYSQERCEGLVVCGGGDRHAANSPVRGRPMQRHLYGLRPSHHYLTLLI